MTREEAIDYGEMWLELQEDSKDSDTYEFFEIATQVLKQEPCRDAISRKRVVEWLENATDDSIEHAIDSNLEFIPPVTPQPKMGRWMYDEDKSDWYDTTYHCSCCKRTVVIPYESQKDLYNDYPYCHCGAKMQEESEKWVNLAEDLIPIIDEAENENTKEEDND